MNTEQRLSIGREIDELSQEADRASRRLARLADAFGVKPPEHVVPQDAESLIADAERYRKLRARHWTDGGYVIAPIGNVQLGSDTLSGDRLDAMIDALPAVDG